MLPVGVKVFKKVYEKLDVDTTDRLLEKIFSVESISVSSISLRDKKLLFRIYSNNYFYQYIFDFTKSDDNCFLSYHDGPGYKCTVVYPYRYGFHFEYPFFDFVQILLCEDYLKATIMLHSFIKGLD